MLPDLSALTSCATNLTRSDPPPSRPVPQYLVSVHLATTPPIRAQSTAKQDRFRTPSACFKPRLEVVALSGDRPDRLAPGEPSLWRVLRERTTAPRLGQGLSPGGGYVDAVLHLGGQAWMGDAFNDAWELFRRRAHEPVLCEDGGWQVAQEEATERLRDVSGRG